MAVGSSKSRAARRRRVQAAVQARRAESEAVAAIQRLRVMAAAAGACREIGTGRVSVADMVSRAGVSRRTFYEIFADRDDCLMAALEEGLRRATAEVLPAYEAATEWREAIRAAIEAFLRFLDEDRLYGALLVVDALGAGDPALERRAQVVKALVDAVDRGRRQARAPKTLTRAAAEGAVGAVLAILHSRLTADGARALSPLAGELTAVVVMPYLGAAAAAREAARKPASSLRRKVPAASSGDPLVELDIRLTYRTIRTLHAIAELTAESAIEPSNSKISARAEIVDQGQMSKLLARLSRVGLVENANLGSARRGEANAWRLTQRGRQLERAMRLHES